MILFKLQSACCINVLKTNLYNAIINSNQFFFMCFIKNVARLLQKAIL